MNALHLSLAERLAADADGILEQLASEYNASLLDVVTVLPEAMRTLLPGERFSEVMADISGWGDVTLLTHSADAILEFHGRVPVGRSAHGFFNLRGGGALSGHIRADRCRTIALVERPFMGLATASLIFFNPDGEAMYKVFVRRNKDKSLDAEQLVRFRALAAGCCGACKGEGSCGD
ncbi:heme utilization cystosolic carrier protein HutX [Jeongeupia wiesaeckerbachi]|uniref:heme utilization cystosolic carrier protein HutX n=1 Tax=Jeongeupia wiesaeckerbachi TaxID=3051218 RepID=UPI003D805863